MNPTSHHLADRTEAPPCVSVTLRSITTTSFVLAIILGLPVYVGTTMNGGKLSGEEEILIGMFIFAFGFLLAFAGQIWHAITRGPFSRNVGATGFLLILSAFPATVLLLLAYDRPSLWSAVLICVVFAVDSLIRSRKSAALLMSV